ncbi:DUF2267 domain-containing protein [Streptomyces mexicanus]|uniref:DUF2267 domain-containing protein n=1 Tax=Streptomyces mexicanus TaxID=178566 RepID=A0A7X1I1K9_9ACTN|nr:DUF2267 domain-containing protein [Streptomyces mexicanus]MBC2867135.1 DUF2267 domain-containing protein [Streptomyces mexicanus]
MTYAEFLATVRDQGGYADAEEARRVATAVIAALGERLPQPTAAHLADQLPAEVGELLADAPDQGRSWGVQEFVHRVAEATGDDEEAARAHAEAVLTTLGHTVSGGELNKLISRLPGGYAEFFGHPELA